MANEILLNNVSADSETTNPYVSRDGPAIINIRADDYGSGTVNIKIASQNDSSERYETMENGSFTADASKAVKHLPAKCLIKAELTGSTSPSNVFVDILQ